MELLEDPLQLRRRNAGAVIADADPPARRYRLQPHADTAATRRGELGGVGQEIHHDLDEAVTVRPHPGAAPPRQVQLQPLAPLLQELADADGRLFDDLRQVELVGLPVHVAGLDLGQIQHLIDQTREALGFAHQDAEEVLALRQVQLRVIVEDLGEGADGGQGGA